MVVAEEWHDNRPCDRFHPKFRIVISITLLGGFTVLAVAAYSFEMMLSGSVIGSLLFATIFGPVIGTVVVVLVHRALTNMPVAISFLPRLMVWRTKDGRLLRASYTEIRETDTSKWKGDWPGGVCNRYVIFIGRSRFSLRTIWLTADNKARLDRAAHGREIPSFPPFDPTSSARRPQNR